MLLETLIFSTILSSTLLPIETPKYEYQEIIDKLTWCESRNRPLAVNKKEKHGYSWGILQFRLSTFEEMNNYYGLKDRDILNPEHQKDLANRMIGDGQGQKHWVNCWTKINN